MSSLARPTARALVQRATGDLAARLRSDLPRLRRSALAKIAMVQARAAADLYTFAEWALRNVLADEAEDDALDRVGGLYGVVRDAATKATSTAVRFTGTAGTPVPAATRLLRGDGMTYTTDAAATVGAGGTVDVACTATVPGAAGNLAASATLAVSPAVAGTGATATVIAAFAGGTDTQTDASYRTEILARVRTEPRGGHADHYATQARAALAAVKAVWTVPGPGKVNQRDVYFTVVGQGAAMVPTAGQVSTVKAYLQARRPLCVDLRVLAPTAVPVPMTIGLNPDPDPPNTDTPERRTAVITEVNALYARRAGARAADATLTIVNSQIREAVARGASPFILASLNGDGTGLSDLAFGGAYASVPIVGAVTWT